MNNNPISLLRQSIEKNLNTDFRHVQLATLDLDGHPACRTVVFRHLDADQGRLFFITDLRSHKVAEIRAHARVEACWYLPGTREQFRLRGEARLLGEGEAPPLEQLRADIWERLSAETRSLFAAPAPGTPVDGEAGPPAEAPSTAPACFALLMLEPDGVDHLALAASPHERGLYHRRKGRWTRRRLHP